MTGGRPPMSRFQADGPVGQGPTAPVPGSLSSKGPRQVDLDWVRGGDGWRADPGEQPDADDHAVLLLTSAGEDVADGLEDAAVGGLTLRWTPLSRDPSR